MKLYKNDSNGYIDNESAIEVSLEEALEIIENFPTEKEFDEQILGFINPMLKFDTIQFWRTKKDDWQIIVPILENNIYTHSLMEDHLTTRVVKKIITSFFNGQDWMNLCNFEKLPIKEETYHLLLKDDGKESINNPNEAGIVSLSEALKRVTEFPREKEFLGGFIGFSDQSRTQAIFFVRHSKDDWFINILELDEWSAEIYERDNLTIGEVKKIVKRFFKKPDGFSIKFDLKNLKSKATTNNIRYYLSTQFRFTVNYDGNSDCLDSVIKRDLQKEKIDLLNQAKNLSNEMILAISERSFNTANTLIEKIIDLYKKLLIKEETVGEFQSLRRNIEIEQEPNLLHDVREFLSVSENIKTELRLEKLRKLCSISERIEISIILEILEISQPRFMNLLMEIESKSIKIDGDQLKIISDNVKEFTEKLEKFW